MLKPTRKRVGWLITVLLSGLLYPAAASAEFTAEERQQAIDVVTAYLIDVGETAAARQWVENWTSRNYSFGLIKEDANVVPGNSKIIFNEQMIVQLRSGARPARRTVGDWAATFTHELVHTRQWKIAWTASEASHLAGSGHPLEAEGWAEGFASYWKWLRLANAKYAKAGNYEDKQKYAKEVVDLAESFKSYQVNFKYEKLGPLPESLRFEALGGREDSPALKIDEAIRQADKISRELSLTLHITVRLSKDRFEVKAGETIMLKATPENIWSPNSKKGNVRFIWKAGSRQLAETGGTLTHVATVDETITVLVQDDRSQKATASCEVIVERPVAAANPARRTPAPTPSAKTPSSELGRKAPSPGEGSKGQHAWVFTGKRTNDWQTKLDLHNAATPAWRIGVSASEGSVTIKNTYAGKRTDAWMKNGISESGTVTWTAPSKSTIRSGDVVSVDLTSLNAPRDHSNFFGIASIKVQLCRLDKAGKRVGSPGAYFKDGDGQDILGYGYPKGNQTKALRRRTVSLRFSGGSSEGERISICVAASGAGQSVESEYIYEWKRF